MLQVCHGLPWSRRRNDDARKKRNRSSAPSTHQKVEDPRFLYWCDRLGLMVWGEMANAYVFNSLSVDRLTREWLDVVDRDYSHPCIVAWVPINESWGVPNLLRDTAQRHFVYSLSHLAK